MIYGRFGDEIVILGGDLQSGAVRIRYNDDGSEDVGLIAYLRADGGLKEIQEAIESANARNAHEAAQATFEQMRGL